MERRAERLGPKRPVYAITRAPAMAQAQDSGALDYRRRTLGSK